VGCLADFATQLVHLLLQDWVMGGRVAVAALQILHLLQSILQPAAIHEYLWGASMCAGLELPGQEGCYSQMLGQLCQHASNTSSVYNHLWNHHVWKNASMQSCACLAGKKACLMVGTGEHSKDWIPVLSVFELAFSVAYVVSELFVPLICLINTSVEVLDVIALVVRPKKWAQAMAS